MIFQVKPDINVLPNWNLRRALGSSLVFLRSTEREVTCHEAFLNEDSFSSSGNLFLNYRTSDSQTQSL